MELGRFVTFGLLLAAAPVGASAQSMEYQLAQKVTARQVLMLDMLSAYWPINDVKSGKSQDFAAAETAARTVPGMMDEFMLLMVPGSAKGEAPGSRARPEVWVEAAEFQLAATDLQAKAIALADAARTEDLTVFSAAFEAYAASCLGCHEFRPSGDGRFRFPRE